MELEYGVKTENKFSFPEFGDDDILDPSEILKRLATSEEKSAASAKQKKLLPQKKSLIITQTAKPQADQFAGSDRARPIRSTFNKENELKGGERGDGSRISEPRGQPRNRLSRQERSDLPPRFRQNDGFSFQQNESQQQGFGENRDQEKPQFAFGFDQQKNEGEQVALGEEKSTNFGSGFGGGEQRGGRGRSFGGRGGIGNRYEVGLRGGRGGRQFDRQSGSDRTGVKSVDKRDGHGAHNWGSTDPQDLGADQMDTSAVAPAAENTDAVVGENEATEVAQQEPVQLTLEEWKAQQGARQQPQFNVRRPGEGEKNPSWDKLKPLKQNVESTKGKKSKAKKEQVIVVDDDDEEYEVDDDNKLVPINIRFIGEPVRRGGRGRGGPNRGGAGPRRGDSGFHQERHDEYLPSKPSVQAIPYVIDDASFPTLS